MVHLFKFSPLKVNTLVIKGLNPGAGCHISDKNSINQNSVSHQAGSDLIAIFQETILPETEPLAIWHPEFRLSPPFGLLPL
jgi:hypothetical protein